MSVLPPCSDVASKDNDDSPVKQLQCLRTMKYEAVM